MLKLKHYQQQTIEKLAAFLKDARLYGDPARAFKKHQDAQGYATKYQTLDGLADVPYLCLRLPTGGGKTLLGSYAIKEAARQYLGQDAFLVVWLVPTDIIRKQTLAVFKNPTQENRRVLDEAFDQNVRVYDITEFPHLRPQDIAGCVNIFVATFASFRVKNKDGRKLYQKHEALDDCFARMDDQPFFDHETTGAPLHSFCNILAAQRPLVIVDEAHNNSSKLSMEVLQRIRPSAVIELTATPAKNSNVLYKVSASALKAEDMIKLPVVLVEEKSWQDAIESGIQERQHLEALAENEPEYLRPILLIQAESKDKDVTVNVVKDYLVNEAKLPEEEIAIATGEQRELDGIDLFDPACKIRYIITVQALKEGWDCSFAYVFVSTAKVQSSKDAEQLLGRVLRMPYAKRRTQDELNQAYAHVAVASWMESVSRIKDNLIGLGFEQEEADIAVEPPQQGTLFVPETVSPQDDETVTVEFRTKEAPDWSAVTDTLPFGFEVHEEKGSYVTRLQNVPKKTLQAIAAAPAQVFQTERDQAEFVHAMKTSGVTLRPPSPSEKGVEFAVMQLCLPFGDGMAVADKEDFLPSGWRLTDYPPTLPAFHYDAERHVYEFDIEGERITESYAGAQQLLHLGHATTWTVEMLITSLIKKIDLPDVSTTDAVEYLRRVIDRLMTVEHVPLADLVRLRFQIQHALEERIRELRTEAYDKGMQATLFAGDSAARVTPDIRMTFRPRVYPANRFYRGSKVFKKHFYPQIADMDSDEEVLCAQCIDANPNVETWVRNIAKEPKCSFWLPTHTDRFYPDFVVKLTDGRVAAIEYKGKHLMTNADSEEKRALGALWAEKSGGRCLFLMATDKDEQGRDIGQQINDFLK